VLLSRLLKQNRIIPFFYTFSRRTACFVKQLFTQAGIFLGVWAISSRSRCIDSGSSALAISAVISACLCSSSSCARMLGPHSKRRHAVHHLADLLHGVIGMASQASRSAAHGWGPCSWIWLTSQANRPCMQAKSTWCSAALRRSQLSVGSATGAAPGLLAGGQHAPGNAAWRWATNAAAPFRPTVSRPVCRGRRAVPARSTRRAVGMDHQPLALSSMPSGSGGAFRVV
jgi:hypothetical protein